MAKSKVPAAPQRQPYFPIGMRLSVKVRLSDSERGLVRMVSAFATVCGVRYDPKNGTSGGPYYTYEVLVDGASNMHNFPEAMLVEFNNTSDTKGE